MKTDEFTCPLQYLGLLEHDGAWVVQQAHAADDADLAGAHDPDLTDPSFTKMPTRWIEIACYLSKKMDAMWRECGVFSN
jgi:hypothetical protein